MMHYLIIGIIISVIIALSAFFPDFLAILNPDPFPEILENMTFSTDDPIVIAYRWIGTFCDLPTMIAVFEVFFTMFAAGWAIMLIWRWFKAR